MANKKTPLKRPTTTCPECGTGVRVDRLDKHINRVHRAREKLPKPIIPEVIGKSELSINKGKSSIKKTSRPIQSHKRRCPYCGNKYLWGTGPLHMKKCDKNPFRRAQNKQVNLQPSSASKNGKTSTDSISQSPTNKYRICPYCQEQLDFEEWRDHVKECASTPRKITKDKSKVDLSKKFTTSLQQKKYISDRFGNVQDYETWFKNQSIGKSDPDKRWQNNVVRPKPRKGKKKKNIYRKSKPHLDANCPECGVKLKSSNLETHINKVHSSKD